MDEVCGQLGRVPDSSTVLVLSIGGNDGLGQLSSFERSPSLGQLRRQIWWIWREFRSSYADTLHLVSQRNIPFVVCTVYYPNFLGADGRLGWGGVAGWCRPLLLQMVACIGVFFINLVIRSEARRRRVPIIDLAWIFNRDQDYANPIEPSVLGGDKISNNIIHALESQALDKRVTATFWSRSYSATHFPDEAFLCPRAEMDAVSQADHASSRLQMAAQNAHFRDASVQSCLPSAAPQAKAGASKRVSWQQDAGSRDRGDVARYESIDTSSGRVWGMPNAGGRGQCLDCPDKVSLPSKRCERCQVAYAQAGAPMPAEDLQRLQAVLEELVLGLPEGQRGDVRTRLQLLFSSVSVGRVQEPIQVKLRGIADAAAAGDRDAARREVAWLAANHWEHHKGWIVALRRLFA